MDSTHYPSRPDTYYAPSGRSDPEKLQAEVDACLRHPVVRLALEMVDSFVVVLNEHRQVITANQELLEAMNVEDASALQGLRLGEVMGCVQVAKGPDGCGTAHGCSRCGAVLAILTSQALQEAVSGECHLDRYADGRWKPCDFRVRATPLVLSGLPFTLVVLQDISQQKRLKQLEGLFLHDALNLVQGLQTWSELLAEPGSDASKITDRIQRMTGLLKDEILQHQVVQQAESGQLEIHMEDFGSASILDRLKQAVLHLPCAIGRELTLDGDCGEIRTDGAVLFRVLGNMIINALEATPHGGEVEVRALREDGHPVFRIHNIGVIPPTTQHRLFQRWFSTKKGRGHGLGAYLIKYLGENVLEGEVGFVSNETEGTTFHLRLPREAAL